jgi:hypothetical protein
MNANLLFREIYEKTLIRKDLQKQKTQLAELLIAGRNSGCRRNLRNFESRMPLFYDLVSWRLHGNIFTVYTTRI